MEPLVQPDYVDGRLTAIDKGSGTVQLEDNDTVYRCVAEGEVAEKLQPYLAGRVLRVFGTATWNRDAGGRWYVAAFSIETFMELQERPLSSALTQLFPEGRGFYSIAVDAFFLKALLDPAGAPDSVTQFFKSVPAEKVRVLIPTPALAKVLTDGPERAQEWTSILNSSACFQVRPFDDKASVELSEILGPNSSGIRDILRFDRQTVAIAKVYRVSAILTEDEAIADFARGCGILVKRLKDLG
jgi:hypothetical protein